MTARTSVIMPAYNAAETILESIESVLAQTVPDLEVVVVDDGSTDNTTEVVGSIDDSRVRLERLERNQGISRARNHAIAKARSPLVSLLDADDTWDPGYLEAVLPALSDPATGLAYSNCRVLRNPNAEEYLPQLSHLQLGISDPAPHPIETFPALCVGCPFTASTVTMRAEAVRGVGGFATWLACGSDWHLFVKLAKAGWRFAYVDEVLATYRWPEPTRGVSFDLGKRELNDLKLWTRFGLRHPLTPGVWSRMAWDARRVAVRKAPFLKRVKRRLATT